MTIAFLGTGLIGAGLVEAALGRGEQVTVWNRSLDKAQALAAKGARVAETPAGAVAGAARVHLALSDDAAVDGVLTQVAPRLAAGALVIDHTTTQPAGTAARAESCAARGIAFLHAPVFMSPALCREAKGMMLCAGPEAVFKQAEGALARMTGQVWYLGERADLAAVFKLFGNAMIIAVSAGLADVLSLAAAAKVAPEDALGLFDRFNPGESVPMRGARMAKGVYAPASFGLAMARKDVRLMLETAGDLPLAALPGIAARMDQVIAAGHGEEDMGVLAAEALARARAGA
ncbi:NAD(P)-dependent oxidoreductase [Chondromyces apiculatus]|nr:NAD(P)-binding domain-containing protein [Chondromyces apiculatus]